MISPVSLPIFAALFTITSALQGQVMHPFTDSACKKSTEIKAKFFGFDVTEINLGLGDGNPNRWRKFNQYDGVTFENASVPESGIGNWVWW